MRRDVLVPELGLKNTRRNRRWLAIFMELEKQLGGEQDENEKLAWRVVKLWEETS